MAVVHPETVDIAGTAWPTYKLEAMAAGLVTGLLLMLITGSPQTAVLAAAAVGALRWVIGNFRIRRIAPAPRSRAFPAH